MNLTTSLIATLPQSQEQKNACCCRQNIENVSVQVPEPGSVLCIRHTHFTCKMLKSWLQLLLKCVKISCLQQELYIRKQGRDFPWKHSNCVNYWQEKGFYTSFPCDRGGVWTTVKGNGARRKTYLEQFPFLSSRAVVNWWFPIGALAGRGRLASHLFWPLVPLLCVWDSKQKQWEFHAWLPLCHPTWLFRELQCSSWFDGQANQRCPVLCFTPSLAEKFFTAVWKWYWFTKI